MKAESIEDVHNLWLRAHNAGDLEGMMSLMEDEACFATRSGRLVAGKEAVLAVYKANLVSRQQMEMGVKKTIPCGDDLALVMFQWKSQATMPDGTLKTWTGLATDIVRRQADGRWLMVLDNACGVHGIV